jgi:hypothetical protein
MLARRHLIAGFAAALLKNSISPLAAAPFEWQRAAPGDAGFTCGNYADEKE